MSVNKRYETLFSPYQIGQIQLKNRIVKSPQETGAASADGGLTDKAYAYYESLAKGGVGLITMGVTSVDHPQGALGKDTRRLTEDKYIAEYAKLADIVHKYGVKIIVQLAHAGPSLSKAAFGLQPVSSSALTAGELPLPGDPPRELTIPEIKELVQKYVDAARRAKKAGFDGVEVHCAHKYLLASFLSPIWNKRQDQYGCKSLEDRARFPVEIITAIKAECGSPDFAVGTRINGQEWGLSNGITMQDGQAFAKMFELAGASYINVTGYGFGNFLWGYWGEQLRFPEAAPEVKPWLKYVKKPGFLVSRAEHIKSEVSIPVIGGGRIDADVAEWDLKHGKMDLFFIGRRMFADPELPNKLAEGREEDIAPCTCCRECFDAIGPLGLPVHCRINASLMKEVEYEIKPAPKKKKVLVVGGGPAGLEASRVAALRGHEVTLYEKRSKLGGSLPLASMIKGLEVEDLNALTSYLKTQITKAGVKVELGQAVDLNTISTINPDVVIIATGGKSAEPKIKGIDNKKVVKVSGIYERSKGLLNSFGPGFLGWLTKFYLPFGKNIVIIGGDIQGLQLAEFLVKRGRKVTIVENREKFGANMVMILANQLIPWLNKKGVTMLSGVKFEEINDQGLVITTKEGKKQTIEADNIFPALPLQPDSELLNAIKGKVPEVYPVGDCREPHRILHAVHDGSRVGRLI